MNEVTLLLTEKAAFKADSLFAWGPADLEGSYDAKLVASAEVDEFCAK